MNYRDVIRVGAGGVVRSGESADLIAIAEGRSGIEAQDDDVDDDIGGDDDDAVDDDAPVEKGRYDPSFDGAGPLPGR
jgi:hypothetical protein